MSAMLAWIALALLCVLALHVILIAAVVFAVVLPNPLRQLQNHGTPERWGLTPELTVVGGATPAWYFGSPALGAAVLVCHGRSRSKRWMLPLVARLSRRWAVMAIDFPSHGDAPYGTTTIGLRESATVGHALTWLRRRGHDRVFIYGVSMGGAASILALADECPPTVVGLVTDGTFDRLPTVIENVLRRFPLMPEYARKAAFAIARRVVGVSPEQVAPVERVGKFDVPALFIHGRRDPLVPPRCAEKLEVAARRGASRMYDGGHDDPTNEEMHEIVEGYFIALEEGRRLN